MHVRTDRLEHEVRLTVEAAIDVANRLAHDADAHEVQAVLVKHAFVEAHEASDIEVDEAHRSLTWLAGIIDQLADIELDVAVATINRALAGRAVTPSISSHDNQPLHIHWTASHVPLAGRVVVDILMALAHTVCEHGVERFGRCSADDCRDLYYDGTKNRSRRFCDDPRCASRTHTANHRARSRNES